MKNLTASNPLEIKIYPTGYNRHIYTYISYIYIYIHTKIRIEIFERQSKETGANYCNTSKRFLSPFETWWFRTRRRDTDDKAAFPRSITNIHGNWIQRGNHDTFVRARILRFSNFHRGKKYYKRARLQYNNLIFVIFVKYPGSWN